MDVTQWAIDLKLAPVDQHGLEDLVRIGNTPQKLVPRARIALRSDGTRLNGAIAQDVGVSLPTVHRWQHRVQDQGVDGLLRDKTRPSRIQPVAPDVVERVVEMTLNEPPRRGDALEQSHHGGGQRGERERASGQWPSGRHPCPSACRHPL
ncbi:helix-turn-helix domain-containing protein [Azospirillum sp.]|uniref:helix-turn-helix domain-containing protein n=1 Tax=Azospirillum sp. TaxID=34012 RepID=UPI003D7602FC